MYRNDLFPASLIDLHRSVSSLFSPLVNWLCETAAHQGYEAIVFLMSISILSVSCRKFSDLAAIIRGAEEETSTYATRRYRQAAAGKRAPSNTRCEKQKNAFFPLYALGVVPASCRNRVVNRL